MDAAVEGPRPQTIRQAVFTRPPDECDPSCSALRAETTLDLREFGVSSDDYPLLKST